MLPPRSEGPAPDLLASGTAKVAAGPVGLGVWALVFLGFRGFRVLGFRI